MSVCCICLDMLGTDCFQLEPCKHVYHKKCIERIPIRSCPLCRVRPTNLMLYLPSILPIHSQYAQITAQEQEETNQHTRAVHRRQFIQLGGDPNHCSDNDIGTFIHSWQLLSIRAPLTSKQIREAQRIESLAFPAGKRIIRRPSKWRRFKNFAT